MGNKQCVQHTINYRKISALVGRIYLLTVTNCNLLNWRCTNYWLVIIYCSLQKQYKAVPNK